MIDLSLFSRPANTYLGSNASASLLGHTRRSAILTYASPLVDTANRVSQMPWYVLGWRKEAEILKVPMMERIEFAKGWKNLPGSLTLTLDSKTALQVYSAKVNFIARFSGLRYVTEIHIRSSSNNITRWIMYNYRILSFIIFTSTFWTVSMTSATLTWLVISWYFAPTDPQPKEEPAANGHANGSAVKTESSEEPFDIFSTESLSNRQRTFPSIGRQMPLRFPLRGQGAEIKQESEPPEEEVEKTTAIEPLTAAGEADDEDEEEEEEEEEEEKEEEGPARRTDSGIGTSLDEGFEGRRREVQRRRSRLFGGGDGGE
jgi:seipin